MGEAGSSFHLDISLGTGTSDLPMFSPEGKRRPLGPGGRLCGKWAALTAVGTTGLRATSGSSRPHRMLGQFKK